MPTSSDSVRRQPGTVVTGIYIARGQDTLGPYNSLEAAALIRGGYLHADDYAARNGDATWVLLADFLPPEPARAVEPATAPTGVTRPSISESHPHRWRRLAATFAVVLAASLAIAGSVHWFGPRRTAPDPAVSPAAPAKQVSVEPPAPSAPAPVSSVSLSLVPAVSLPAPVVDGLVEGSLSCTRADGERLPFAGVRVSVYSLAALEPALAEVRADAQAARARLDPEIEAARATRDTRVTEAQAALRAWREANPADPLIASLRFANQLAKTSARTAEDDLRFLLEERAAAAGGDVYFRGLPAPAVTTDTDAQGSFTLLLPPDEERYAVAACASETRADGGVRLRYWLVELSPAQRSGRQPLRLDDRNASYSPAAESLIHTAD